MWRAASRDSGLAEVVHGVGGSFLAVIGDDRGVFVEITEVEAAAAELADVEFVCVFADARSYRVALRSGLLKVVGDRVAQRFPRGERVHRVTRNLLGDRLAFDLVRVEDRGIRPALDYASEHPRQVHGVGDPGIHAVTAKGHPDMRGVATQKNAPVAKAVGDHAAPGPVLLSENLELERGLHAQDLLDAVIAIERRQVLGWRPPVVDEPSLPAVDRE